MVETLEFLSRIACRLTISGEFGDATLTLRNLRSFQTFTQAYY